MILFDDDYEGEEIVCVCARDGDFSTEGSARGMRRVEFVKCEVMFRRRRRL